jgi:phosphoglycerate kinase
MHPRTRTLADLAPELLRGKRVLVRVDYNVPLDSAGNIADDTRLRATLPTLKHLREGGARSLLVSHLGRPDGAPDPKASLAPVASWLAAHLEIPVALLTEPPGSTALLERAEALTEGEVALLENIRFHPGETRNDPDLAAALAELADGFVGDAFGAAHRAHASTEGVARAVQDRGGFAVAGSLMERELRFLRDALAEPARPFVVVLGGAKISGKMDIIEAVLPRVDRLLVGGAMANTFFRALGLDTGASLVEEDRVPMANALMERAGDRLVLPVDCVVGDRIEADADVRSVARTEVRGGDRIGDIGPKTQALFASILREAATIVWNGPMGVFECAPYAGGTEAVAVAMAKATEGGTLTVLGGGDSAAAAEGLGLASAMGHVSTGGGASLDLLAGKPLPGVDVLETVP